MFQIPATGSRPLSPAKLTRLPLIILLLPLALLAGCARQLKPDSAVQATPVPAAPVAAANEAAPQPAAADPAPADLSLIPHQPIRDAAATQEPSATADLDSASLPGPPADSVVTVKQIDLLERLRGGFELEDVNEPAVAAQLNWFANHPDFLERTFGRSELWLYYIVGQLERRHMPRELALLPVIESAFEPYAYSPARAAGLWQFISDTGRRFGLKQDWWYDGRRDPIEATRAGGPGCRSE